VVEDLDDMARERENRRVGGGGESGAVVVRASRASGLGGGIDIIPRGIEGEGEKGRRWF